MNNQNKTKDICEMRQHCGSAEELYAYLSAKGKKHNSYKHYSSMERIQNIVQKREIYLKDGVDWNDVIDSSNFNNDAQNIKTFGMCFSFLQDESVAMWRIYGNHDQRGAMIDFTQKGMNSVLQAHSVEVGYFDEQTEQFCKVITLEKPDFEIDLVDVVYYNPKSGYIKRSDEGCCIKDKNVLDQLGAYKKYYPWNYENECRLVVTIRKDVLPENCSVVRLDIGQATLGKSLERIYASPEYTGEEKGFRQSELQKCVSFRDN